MRRFQERERLLLEAHVVGQKIEWAKAEDLKRNVEETKQALAAFKAKLKAAKGEFAQASVPIWQKEGLLSAAREAARRTQAAAKDADRALHGRDDGAGSRGIADRVQTSVRFSCFCGNSVFVK